MLLTDRIALLLILSACGFGCAAHRPVRPDDTAATLKLLDDAAKDEAAEEKIHLAVSSHATLFTGTGIYYSLNRPTYARLRLIACGHAIATAMRVIAESDQQSPATRVQALQVLARVDPEYALRHTLRLSLAGVIDERQTVDLIEQASPRSDVTDRQFVDGTLNTWADRELKANGFSTYVKDRIGEIIDPPGDKGSGVYVLHPDLLRWLNRRGADDLDDVLAR